MKYPVENFKQDWNITAGFNHGDITEYGRHDGHDINLNGGGNNDLGKPCYAVADGVISSVHEHSTGFGKHIHLRAETDEGTRYFHYAHLNKIFVGLDQIVKEGQIVGEIGNTGTVYAHLHFACKKKPTGIDAIAKDLASLNDGWEDPIAFIERQMIKAQTPPAPTINDQTKIDLGPSVGVLEVQQIRSRLLDNIRDISDLRSQIANRDQTINELTSVLDDYTKTNSMQAKRIEELQKKLSGVDTQSSQLTLLIQKARDGIKALRELIGL